MQQVNGVFLEGMFMHSALAGQTLRIKVCHAQGFVASWKKFYNVHNKREGRSMGRGPPCRNPNLL